MRKPQFLDRVPTTALIIVLVVFGLAMIPLGFYLGQTAQTATNQRDTAVQQRDQATTKADQGKTLAQQVQAACAAGGSTEQQLQSLGACHQATVVQQTQTPLPGPPGQNGTNGSNGTNGTNGADGRSITGEQLVGNDLVLSFNQAPFTQDVGAVVGPAGTNGKDGQPGTAGTNGANGADGCSITGTSVSSAGDLLVTYGAQTACGTNASQP